VGVDADISNLPGAVDDKLNDAFPRSSVTLCIVSISIGAGTFRVTLCFPTPNPNEFRRKTVILTFSLPSAFAWMGEAKI